MHNLEMSDGQISLNLLYQTLGSTLGMQPNFNKVIYYQWLVKVPFWKSGPDKWSNLVF